MNFEKYIVQEEDNILDVMRKINKNPQGAMFVCKNNQLIGSITDGDIRRYLIKKGSLNSNVKNVYNKNPIFLYADEKVDYESFMKAKQLKSIPILDKNMCIVNIVVLNDTKEIISPKLNIPVVIMAGGKGTRLIPYTNILPKPLIPIGEKTITECIMERFERFGCNKFNMIVNYKKNFIKSYFGENDIKKDIVFTEEESFLGTGGGLKLLEGKYKTSFFMTNCDVIIEADYSKILKKHKLQKNIITIVCARKNITLPYGIVNFDNKNRLLNLEEKPSFNLSTNTGFYVIEPEFLKLIPDNTFIHITELIQKCLDKSLNVGVYEIDEHSWLDMGQIEELKKMQEIIGG